MICKNQSITPPFPPIDHDDYFQDEYCRICTVLTIPSFISAFSSSPRCPPPPAAVAMYPIPFASNGPISNAAPSLGVVGKGHAPAPAPAILSSLSVLRYPSEGGYCLRPLLCALLFILLKLLRLEESAPGPPELLLPVLRRKVLKAPREKRRLRRGQRCGTLATKTDVAASPTYQFR